MSSYALATAMMFAAGAVGTVVGAVDVWQAIWRTPKSRCTVQSGKHPGNHPETTRANHPGTSRAAAREVAPWERV